MKAIQTGFRVPILRAMGMLYPKEKRLYNDPLSEKLVSGMDIFWFNLIRIPKMFDLMMKYGEKRAPGAMGSFFCRFRYIDDLLKNSITTKEIETVVNLGAGTPPFGCLDLSCLSVVARAFDWNFSQFYPQSCIDDGR